MHFADGITLKEGAIGGLIIGISASTFLYLSGKITGLSGIVEGLVVPEGQDWNISYVLGLIAAGAISQALIPDNFGLEPDLSVSTLAVAGLITGFGTRLSGGCTSGHGLCGLGRFSPRSLTAVLTFMTTGVLTASISRSEAIRPLLTSNFTQFNVKFSYYIPSIIVVAYGIKSASYINYTLKKPSSLSSPLAMHIVSFVSGLVFGSGLTISGMASSQKILRFLDFFGSEGWDPSLIAVLGCGVGVTSLIFPYLQRNSIKTALTNNDLGKSLKIGAVPENLVIDWKLIVGSLLFGVGWGLSGVCPGPGMVNLGAGHRVGAIYFPALVAGIILKDRLLTQR